MWKSPEEKFSEAFDAAMEAREAAKATVYPFCTMADRDRVQRAYYDAKRKMYEILKDSISSNARRDA